MINFMCQLDWAMGGSHIWSSIILSVSTRVFWMRLTLKLADSVKPIVLANVGGPHQSGECLKRTEGLTLQQTRENSPCLMAFEQRTSAFFPAFRI